MALSAITRAALEEHLPLLRDGEHARRHGWKVDWDEASGICYVEMQRHFGSPEVLHKYLLRLSFNYYPQEQPGVTFVNPETRAIGAAEDFERWWPNIDGNPWINVQINAAEPAKSYLCFQWTHEFSETHGALAADDPKKWDQERHNVVGVAAMVQRAISSAHYKGYRKQP